MLMRNEKLQPPFPVLTRKIRAERREIFGQIVAVKVCAVNPPDQRLLLRRAQFISQIYIDFNGGGR